MKRAPRSVPISAARLGRLLLGWSVLAILAIPGCGGGGAGGGGGGGGAPPVPGGGGLASVLGKVTFTTGSPARLLEVEPNDSLDEAQPLGALRPGRAVAVHGRGSARSDADPFDGFELQAPERVVVTATLSFPGAAANAFDVVLYEPTGLQVVARVAADESPKAFTFVAKGTVDLVVQATSGEAEYDLTLSAMAVGASIAERGPIDGLSGATPLGDLLAGDAARVTGALGAPPAPAHGFLVACPAGVRLVAEATWSGIGTLDLAVSDATQDLARPSPLTPVAAAAGPSPRATYDVDAGTLLRIEVDSRDGAGPYALSLRAEALPPTVHATARVERTRSIASLDGETRRSRRSTPGRFFGRPGNRFESGQALVTAEAGREAVVASDLAARGCAVVESTAGAPSRISFAAPEALGAEDRARLTLARVLALRAAPGVRTADPNFRRQAFATPTDPRYAEQWNYSLIHCPEAWDVATGSASVIVAVIDTGRTNHPDLQGQQAGGYDFISDPGNALDGDGRDADPTDPGDGGGVYASSFHATHVAGTIGAATNNGTGVSGINWRTQIMHLRVLGYWGATDSDLVAAVRYAAGLPNAAGVVPPRRADVINMSLGGGGYSQTFQDAITAARDAGVVICASAGNQNSSTPNYPASFSGVISVAAVDRNARKAFYSSFGRTVDLAAPGGDTRLARADGVLSTLYDDSGGTPVATYDFYQGTSMACPHVAGVAALVLSVDPHLGPAQVEAILTSTADDLGEPGRDDTFGYGLVNAYRAVLKAQAIASGDPLLVLDMASLWFTDGTTSSDAGLSNGGGGLLTIDAVTVSTESGGSWLFAATFGTGDATKDVSGVRMTVDPGGLPDGTYRGTVSVSSNGGSQSILVALAVGSTGPPPPDTNVDVYVLALDAYGNMVDWTIAAGGDRSYGFGGLPPDAYGFVAGSDENGNGWIGEPGEWYGEFPGTLTVDAGSVVTGVDIDLSVQPTAPPPAHLSTRGLTEARAR